MSDNKNIVQIMMDRRDQFKKLLGKKYPETIAPWIDLIVKSAKHWKINNVNAGLRILADVGIVSDPIDKQVAVSGISSAIIELANDDVLSKKQTEMRGR